MIDHLETTYPLELPSGIEGSRNSALMIEHDIYRRSDRSTIATKGG